MGAVAATDPGSALRRRGEPHTGQREGLFALPLWRKPHFAHRQALGPDDMRPRDRFLSAIEMHKNFREA